MDSRAVQAAMLDAVARGLNNFAEDLMGEAQRLAPVDTGTLRESASLDEATPGSLEAQVSFGTVYAASQHEGLEFNHPEGGQPKYLEGPLLRMSGELEDYIAAELRKEF